jgi:hypothetical protein
MRMSALPQAIAPNPHTNLLNVYIQIANRQIVRNIACYFVTKNVKWLSVGYVPKLAKKGNCCHESKEWTAKAKLVINRPPKNKE